MSDDKAMIAHGEQSGAWPTAIRFADVFATSQDGRTLQAPGQGLIASYLNPSDHPDACLAVVGDRYRATTPEEWRSLVKAAVAAGAKPTGCFSLRDGARVLATFEIGQSNGLRTQLVMADAFDGTMRLTAGFTSIRVVCANTLSAAMSSDGAGMAQLRHTASLETKVNVLSESIGQAVVNGDKVRDAYHKAEALKLTTDQAMNVFDLLFPKADKDDGKAAITRADNARADARRAMANPVNQAGPTLATLWNAATYLVDREVDGSARKTRGGSAIDSLLFGSRGNRITEVQTMIDVILRDGSVQSVPASEALAMGAPADVVGRNVLADMIADLS
jgi:hypothetical protein